MPSMRQRRPRRLAPAGGPVHALFRLDGCVVAHAPPAGTAAAPPLLLGMNAGIWGTRLVLTAGR